MSEKYRNIFCYYRGPKHSNETEKQGALENNVTKALLNTLDLCPNLGTQFVEWLNDKLYEKYSLRLLDPPTIAELRILEGPTPEEIETKTHKIMLGIKKYNGECVPGEKRKGKVDGTIVGQEWLIAIESKLGHMYKLQLQKEKEMIGSKEDLIISWRDIHDFFYELDAKQCESIEKLFIEQFTSYLNTIGQLPFQGLKKKHFDFFAKDKSEREKERLELKDLINTLGADLYNNENLKDLYKGEWDCVKGLNKNNALDYAELKFYLSSRKKIENQCYLGIMFQEKYPGTLDVYGCAGTKKVLKKLSDKLCQNRDRNRFYKILNERSLAQFVIQLWDDCNDNLLMNFLPNSDVSRIAELNLLELGEFLHHHIERKGLGFGVTRRFEQNEIIALYDGQKQVAMIAEAMKTLQPVIQFVND